MDNGNKTLLIIGIVFLALLIYNPNIFSIYSASPSFYAYDSNNSLIIQNWRWNNNFNDTLILKTEINGSANYYCYDYNVTDYSFLKTVSSIDTLIIPERCKLNNKDLSLKIVLGNLKESDYKGSSILYEEPEVNETINSTNETNESINSLEDTSYSYSTGAAGESETSEESTSETITTEKTFYEKYPYTKYLIIVGLILIIGLVIYRRKIR